MSIITKAMKNKSKKQFQLGVRIGFFSANGSNWDRVGSQEHLPR